MDNEPTLPQPSDQEIYRRIQAEAGKKGGDTTRKKYGSSYYAKIGKKGGKGKQPK